MKHIVYSKHREREYLNKITDYHRVATHPNVNFTVVINPGSGPGPNPLPDGNYTREIPKLASYDNVRLLGYIATTYATRDISLVRKDVETYAGWSTNSSIPGLAVRGIFLDETPQQYEANAFAYLEELRDFVRRAPGLGPDNYVCSHASMRVVSSSPNICSDISQPRGHS